MHTEQIVRSEAGDKGVRLDFALMAFEHHVAGDAARLHQVFWNLLKNAIRFTPADGQIIVRTHNPDPGKLSLSVTDTGSGIDERTLPVIFRAFEQGDTGAGQSRTGLGLGLSISKAIVELHGGTIYAASDGPGLGAQFVIEVATASPRPQSKVSAAEPRSGQRRLHRLLVVEDDEPTLHVLTGLLRRHGHDVLSAITVKDALLLAASHTFDLVISDIGLPDGNGIDLMSQLTNNYGLRGIALTGYGMAEDKAKTEQAGFLAHLVKPINFEQLNRLLEHIEPTGSHSYRTISRHGGRPSDLSDVSYTNASRGQNRLPDAFATRRSDLEIEPS
jgi:CheY-like chemotaxis protein